MNETEHEIEMQEICTIQIAFPVDSDEQAIGYKKKITEILSDISNARIEFALTPLPKLTSPNASSTAKPNQ